MPAVRGKKMASKFKEKKDLINKMSKERMAICQQCPELSDLKICGKCRCMMPLKTKIPKATCPLEKW